MTKEDYQKGDVKLVIGDKIPISEVSKISTYAERKGTVFRKQYENTSIIGVSSPSNVFQVGITQANQDNYSPFNRLEIHNLGDTDIDVRFNGSTTNKEIILSKTSKIWGKDDKLLFNFLDIYNRDTITSIPISKIVLIVSRVNE